MWIHVMTEVVRPSSRQQEEEEAECGILIDSNIVSSSVENSTAVVGHNVPHYWATSFTIVSLS